MFTVSISTLIGGGVFVMSLPFLLQIEKKTMTFGWRLAISSVLAGALGFIGYEIPNIIISNIQEAEEFVVMAEELPEPWDILYRECVKADSEEYRIVLLEAWKKKYPDPPKLALAYEDLFQSCKVDILPENLDWGFSLKPGEPK